MTSPPSPPSQVPLLRSIRLLWAGFTGALAVIAFVVPAVVPDAGSSVPALLPIALAATAGLGALAGIDAIDRAMAAATPRDDRAAVAELRSRLVMQAAIAEAPALLAVALAFVLGPPLAATAGALPGLIGMLRVRPSTARFDRFDQAWRAAGLDASLRRALT